MKGPNGFSLEDIAGRNGPAIRKLVADRMLISNTKKPLCKETLAHLRANQAAPVGATCQCVTCHIDFIKGKPEQAFCTVFGEGKKRCRDVYHYNKRPVNANIVAHNDLRKSNLNSKSK